MGLSQARGLPSAEPRRAARPVEPRGKTAHATGLRAVTGLARRPPMPTMTRIGRGLPDAKPTGGHSRRRLSETQPLGGLLATVTSYDGWRSGGHRVMTFDDATENDSRSRRVPGRLNG
jgi:hypothetical protein